MRGKVARTSVTQAVKEAWWLVNWVEWTTTAADVRLTRTSPEVTTQSAGAPRHLLLSSYLASHPTVVFQHQWMRVGLQLHLSSSTCSFCYSPRHSPSATLTSQVKTPLHSATYISFIKLEILKILTIHQHRRRSHILRRGTCPSTFESGGQEGAQRVTTTGHCNYKIRCITHLA